MKQTGFGKIIIWFLLIAFCFLFPHYAGFPIFIYPIIVLVVVWLVLKYTTKENFTHLFFSFRRFKPAAIWIGVVAAVLYPVFLIFCGTRLLTNFFLTSKLTCQILHTYGTIHLIMLLCYSCHLSSAAFMKSWFFMVLFLPGLKKFSRGGMLQ